jgi:hypothetical protein
MAAHDIEFFMTIQSSSHPLQFSFNEGTQIPTTYSINNDNKVTSFMLSKELAIAIAIATASDKSPSNFSSSDCSVKSFLNNLCGRSEDDDMITNSFITRLRMKPTCFRSRKKPITRSAPPRGPLLSRPPSILSPSVAAAKRQRPIKRYGRHSNDWLFGGFSFRKLLFGIDPQ